MTNAPLLSTELLPIFRAVLRRDFAFEQDIRRRETVQWDSLRHIELMFAIEDHFEVQFSEHQLATLDSLYAIAAALGELRAP